MASISIPPAIGSRVTIRLPEWAKGLTGIVDRHVELHDKAKGRDGRPIEGHSFEVRLDRTFRPAGKDYVFTHARWLLQGDAI